MRKKIMEEQQKLGARLACRKALVKDKLLDGTKDAGLSAVVVAIILVCIGAILAFLCKDQLSNLISTLSGKAQTEVTKQFG